MSYKIVHYLFRDVFTSGYIDFMVDVMKEYQHVFIMKRTPKVFKHGIKSDKATTFLFNPAAKIIFIDEDCEIIENSDISKEIYSCDQLIISGLFDDLSYFLQYPEEIWEKTYLHFWGGDFYCYRKDNMADASEKRFKDKQNILEAIQRCKAVLNVLDTDYEKMVSVLNIEKLHFEAPMPEQTNDIIDVEKYKSFVGKNKKIKIIIGNSAASDNCHIEIFEKLSWLASEECEIVCPLSYGELAYRECVMAEGQRLFGDKIRFLTEYMDLESYIKLLAGCDIGIYNNNRQQGFKNITTMLALGKKVFLRNGTATWNKLQSLGIKLFSIENIIENDMNCFSSLDSSVAANNRMIIQNFLHSYRGKWEYVLNKKSQNIMMKRMYSLIGLNIHLTDHCNLLCKGCSHFAPIADEKYISKMELEKTLKTIFSKTKSVFQELCLMGGEPLLHPELADILTISRKNCGEMPITLITNGLLLKKLEQDFWEACKKNNISIQITCYPINFDYDEVIEYVKSQEVNVEVYVDRRDGGFRRDKLEIDGQHNRVYNYSRCRIGGIYPQVKDYKLYKCATAANIESVNKRFQMNFEHNEDDYLEIEKIVDDEQVREFLLTSASFCRYCNLEEQQFAKWDFSKKQKEEWL